MALYKEKKDHRETKQHTHGFTLSCVTLVGSEGQKKYAAQCSPLNTLQSEVHVSP